VRETSSWLAGNAPEVAAAIDPRLRVLHDLDSTRRAGGGDVDCVVPRLDERWPLRLAGGWRVCQLLRYDIGSTYWVLERDGGFLAVDILDDRRGVGQYGFPTRLALEDERPGGSPGALAAPAVRAAYLTAKRLRKRIEGAAEWQRIRELAAADPRTYRETLDRVLGTRAGAAVAESVLEQGLPPAPLRADAERALRARRRATPLRALAAAALQAARVAERVVRPTGLVVAIVGPDGTGKSTLARALPDAVDKPFRRTAHVHFRPGVLPRPGAVAGRPARDATRPQSVPPHGQVMSVGLLLYYWLDFVVGSWLRLKPLRVRSGLVVVERGWWDIHVDPTRYRLAVPEPLVRVLGAFVPRADLLLVLGADPDVVLARKAELARDELVRQLEAWRELAPPRTPTVRLNAEVGETELVALARDVVVEALERRTASRLGGGWLGIGGGTVSRLFIPRRPRRAARHGLAVYNPQTPRARVVWRAARALAPAGALRVLPRGEAPPASVREALAPYVPPGGTYAVARSIHPGRWTALVLCRAGEPSAFVKLASDERGAGELEREHTALDIVGETLPAPLAAPHVLDHRPGLLVLAPILWHYRREGVEVPPEVARALGRFFRASATEGPTGLRGNAHGDCAPWNLLRTDGGWLLVDWEAYRDDAPAFYDLFHHAVQTYAAVGRPQLAEVARGLDGRGPLAAAIRAYADGAGLDASEAREYFRVYLRAGQEDARLMRLVGPPGVELRKRLLEAWDAA
jgi:hypothetical protein